MASGQNNFVLLKDPIKVPGIHTTKYLDLDKINISDKGILYYEDGNTKIYLDKETLIGKGAGGKIYRSSNKDKTYSIVLKDFFYNDDHEIAMIKKLNDYGVDCNLINARLITNQGINFVIMNYMPGSLYNLIEILGKLSIEVSLTILKQLVNNLQCLLTKGFKYTDIKSENILYRFDVEDKIIVKFGDLGSICDKYTEDPISSYPSWKSWDILDKESGYVGCDEKEMVWALGILFIDMALPEKGIMVGDKNINKKYLKAIFHFTQIRKNKEENLQEYIEKALAKIFPSEEMGKYKALIKEMLNFEPSARPTLQHIYDILKPRTAITTIVGGYNSYKKIQRKSQRKSQRKTQRKTQRK